MNTLSVSTIKILSEYCNAREPFLLGAPAVGPRVLTIRHLLGQSRGGQGAIAPRRMQLDPIVDFKVAYLFGRA